MTGCVTVTVRLAGAAAGSFELRFGDAAPKAGHGSDEELVHLARHVLHPGPIPRSIRRPIGQAAPLHGPTALSRRLP